VRSAVAGAPDLELLATGASFDSANVVVTTNEDDTVPAAVGVASRLRVLTIDRRDQHGALYRLNPSRVELGELSLAKLTDAIRRAASDAPGRAGRLAPCDETATSHPRATLKP